MFLRHVLRIIGGFGCLATLPALAVEQPAIPAQIDCGSDGHLWAAVEGEDLFLYRETEGTWNAEAAFLRIRDGQMVWAAQAQRECSVGVVMCGLMLPYNVDGQEHGAIEAEITYGRLPDGRDVISFSQLDSRILHLIYREHPEASLTWQGAEDWPFSSEDRDGFVLPPIYEKRSCG